LYGCGIGICHGHGQAAAGVRNLFDIAFSADVRGRLKLQFHRLVVILKDMVPLVLKAHIPVPFEMPANLPGEFFPIFDTIPGRVARICSNKGERLLQNSAQSHISGLGDGNDVALRSKVPVKADGTCQAPVLLQTFQQRLHRRVADCDQGFDPLILAQNHPARLSILPCIDVFQVEDQGVDFIFRNGRFPGAPALFCEQLASGCDEFGLIVFQQRLILLGIAQRQFVVAVPMRSESPAEQRPQCESRDIVLKRERKDSHMSFYSVVIYFFRKGCFP